MEKHKHLVWAIVAILIIAGGAVYCHKMKGAPSAAPGTTPATGSAATGTPAATTAATGIDDTHNAAGKGSINKPKSMQYTCHCSDGSTRSVSNITDCGPACGGAIAASHGGSNIRAWKAWA